MFVAVDATAPVGFITLHQHGPAAWEIHAVGVLPDHHRLGLGRRLLEEGERWLRTHDAEFLTVKTLSASAEYEPYERTRAFYLAMGFLPLAYVEQNAIEGGETWHQIDFDYNSSYSFYGGVYLCDCGGSGGGGGCGAAAGGNDRRALGSARASSLSGQF